MTTLNILGNSKRIKKSARIRQMTVSCLLLFLMFLITACGDSSETPSLGIDGYVYAVQELSLPLGEYSPYNFKSHDGSLYYKVYNSLYKTSLEDAMSGKSPQLIITIDPDDSEDLDNFDNSYSSLDDYVPDSEGGLYYYIQDFTFGENWETIYTGGVLTRLAPDGTTLYESPLPDANTMVNSIFCLAIDKEGQAFLLAEDGIFVIDPEGNLLTIISIEETRHQKKEGKEQLIMDGDGHIYYLVSENPLTVPTLYEITNNGGFQLTRRDEILKDMNGTFYGGENGLLCDNENGSLYQYSAEDSAWHEKLRWEDSNLKTGASSVTEPLPDVFIVYYNFYGADSSSALFALTKNTLEELPEKELLVLATTNSWSQLDEAIASFNMASDQYHITLELYEGEEGLTRLDSALVSANPPDLLDLSGLDITKYVQKQLIEDLYPYLENSSVLSREDFLENLLEGYTIDGKLCCIPSSFSFYTIMGRTSQVGSDAGWTMEDVMALTEEYPDARLLDRGNFEYALNRFCHYYIMDTFIDWNDGSCSFDSPEFHSMVKWMQDHTRDIYYGYDENLDYTGGVVPADMLLLMDYISSPLDYAFFSYYWDSPATLIGYPTEDGHPVYTANVQNAVCMVSRSRHQEGAWQFLEYFLSGAMPEPYTFSSRREALYQAVEEQTTPLYDRDENGEIIIHEHFFTRENGQTVEHWNEPWIRARSYMDLDGEEIPYYYMEQQQADALLEILENLDFTPQPYIQSDILDIIMEEIAPYLSGDKTLEEAAGIIQNRVRTLVQESL